MQTKMPTKKKRKEKHLLNTGFKKMFLAHWKMLNHLLKTKSPNSFSSPIEHGVWLLSWLWHSSVNTHLPHPVRKD